MSRLHCSADDEKNDEGSLEKLVQRLKYKWRWCPTGFWPSGPFNQDYFLQHLLLEEKTDTDLTVLLMNGKIKGSIQTSTVDRHKYLMATVTLTNISILHKNEFKQSLSLLDRLQQTSMTLSAGGGRYRTVFFNQCVRQRPLQHEIMEKYPISPHWLSNFLCGATLL